MCGVSVGRLVTISNTCFSCIMISRHTNLFFCSSPPVLSSFLPFLSFRFLPTLLLLLPFSSFPPPPSLLLLPSSLLLLFPSLPPSLPPSLSLHQQDPDYVVEMNEEHPEFKKLAFTSPGPKNAFAPLKRVLGRKGNSFVKSENDSVFAPPGEDCEQEMGGIYVYVCMCTCVWVWVWVDVWV